MTDSAIVTVSGPEQVVVSSDRRERLALPGCDDAVRRFHTSMPGYEVTPLRDAPASAARLGVGRVLVKDESARLGLPSFKLLGVSWAVCRAVSERQGANAGELASFGALARAVAGLRPLTLSAATDGNHGRAVARMAKLLGLDARIYVPAGTAQARIDGILAEDAEVTVVGGNYDDAVRRSGQDAGERCLVICDTSWAGYEDVPWWVIQGYETIFSEVEAQLSELGAGRPDAAVVPVGVGALAAAAVGHFWALPAPRPLLVGVEPTSAACVLESVTAGSVITLGHPQDSIMAGLNCPTPSLVAWPLLSQGIDVYLAVEDRRVSEAMQLLARDRIVAGETGAAALAGMLRVADDDDDAVRRSLPLSTSTTVLVLCTEGATDPDAYRRLTSGSP